jgi:photosystem II stability/assembly factor-like uncharacterized protein
MTPGSWKLNGVEFMDDRRGIAVGDGSVYVTDDGGNRWKSAVLHANGRSSTVLPVDSRSPTFTYLDKEHAWLSLDERSFYRSRDGGKNWNQVAKPEIPYFEDLQFVDASRALGIAHGSELLESQDGGASWRSVKMDTIPQSLCFLDKDHFWLLSDTALYQVQLQ